MLGADVVKPGVPLYEVPAMVQRDEYPYEAMTEYMGIPVMVETAKGSIRRGKTWAVKMPAHYGEIAGVGGVDGEPLDVFIGPLAQCDRVYVIQSRDPKTGSYDEDKVMLGFWDEQHAIDCYRASYTIEMPECRVLSFTWPEFWQLCCDRSEQGILHGVPLAKAGRR